MKKIILIMLIAVIVLLIGITISDDLKETINQEENLSIGEILSGEKIGADVIYEEKAELSLDELLNLCNKKGVFLIRKKLDNNTFLVHLLSESNIKIENGERELLRDSIDYGEKALEKIDVLKINNNTVNMLTHYTEGLIYDWSFYRKENDETIYVPNPLIEVPYLPLANYLSSEIEIINDSNHEILKGNMPNSIIKKIFNEYDESAEVEKIKYEYKTFPTILNRAKLIHSDFENLYKYGIEITKEEYEKNLKASSNIIEFKYDNKMINIFPSDFSNFDALIMNEEKYYIIEEGILDEWNVSILFVILNIF